MDARIDPNAAAMAAAKHAASFNPVSEVIYEDDETDTSIPDIQKITKKNNVLPIHGSENTMNLNNLVLENIIRSTYYKNYLIEVLSFQQASDEVYYSVSHLEPWEKGTRKTQGITGMCGGVRGVGAGGVISTAFCVLYKMFTFRITRKQLVGMINSTQSVFMRGMGFLYIRYTQPPADLWAWFEPYLQDEEEIDPRSGGGSQMTIGQMVRQMLTKLDWYGTLFPRIPVPIQKDIDAKLMSLGRRQTSASDYPKREAEHERSSRDAEKRPKRCHHHLRHHHCAKHRHRCPTKAKKAAESKKTDREKTSSEEKTPH